jgi:hypothetical protein
MEEAPEQLTRLLTETWWFIYPYLGQITAFGILVVAILLLVRRIENLERERRMPEGKFATKGDRKAYQDRYIADGITNMLEEGEYRGLFSRAEVQDKYLKLAIALGLTMLMPRKRLVHRSQKELKAEIKDRRANANGMYKPVPLPGDEPPIQPASVGQKMTGLRLVSK